MRTFVRVDNVMDQVREGGACFLPGRTWESRKAVRGESRREQHFYRYIANPSYASRRVSDSADVFVRYYGPFREMSDYGPQYCDVRDPDARKKHKPVSCPDKILTALCQLGALRLKARRCLIFFFDVNHAYILAEATKSLSLENDAIHEAGDEVWMGHSVIPRDVACCETTVNLPSFPISGAVDSDIRKSAFVVNDLTKHPDLSTRPYVTGYPNGRFYAGVPITTPDGVNIGAYCILDDKIRDGLAENDINFLGDMSQTVMTHLETVRALSERQQNHRMMSGLGRFMRGAPDAGRKASPATHMPLSEGGSGDHNLRNVEYRLPDALDDSIKTPLASSQSMSGYFGAELETNSSSDLPGVPERHTTRIEQSSTRNKVSPTSERRHSSFDYEAHPDSRNVSEACKSQAKDRPRRPSSRTPKVTNDPKTTYQRAAETLCQSLDIDGVAFLDASVRAFGGLSEAQNADSNEGTTTADSDDSANNFSHSDSAGELRSKNTRVCRVLGCAQTLRGSITKSNHPEPRPQRKLTDTFLRRLMRRNPQGRVWTFDENLKLHSEDGVSSDESGTEGKIASALSPGTQQRKAARRARRNDGDILQAAFPGSRCIALHGIWDYTRKRWTAAGLYWTFDPLRHIAKEAEMQFVAAFCDIIVAETKRLEVLETDKAKSDFISTVSHELRSPLHGILGSCELLLDHGLDNTAMTFLEQIDSCGRTLLEIIEHLLDFANLKIQRLRQGAVKSSRNGRNQPPIGNVIADDSRGISTTVSLDDATEDAVVSSVYSFHYRKNPEQYNHPPVILDIDRSDGKAWNCSLAAGGWKRICINLVTNALKYTPSGSIRISLKQEPQSKSDRRFNAVLKVSDTGKGMSKEFQNNHLFNDFAQEDTLSDGLGLGMHMVSRIVYTMGGKIEVISDRNGSGTCVTVRVPLEQTKGNPSSSDTGDEDSVVTTGKTFEGLRAGIITGSQLSATVQIHSTLGALAMAISSIENNLRFLGVNAERCETQDLGSRDLMIVMEAGIDDCLTTLRKNGIAHEGPGARNEGHMTPILVICDNIISAQSLRSSWSTNDLRFQVIMEYIALPCGVKQLTQSISSVLRMRTDHVIPVLDRSNADELRHGQSWKDPVALRLVRNYEPPTLPPPVPRTGTSEISSKMSFKNEAVNDSTNVSHKDPNALFKRLSLAEVSPTQLSGRRLSVPIPDAPAMSTSLRQTPSSAVPSPSTVSPATRAPMLLLVDDNNVNLKLLAAFARKHGYPHMTAQDGQLAVNAFISSHTKHMAQNSKELEDTDKVNGGTPNIILMDINMPVMDGYEAVQRIRSYERQHHMTASKIIAVTALQSEEAQGEAYGSGFDMFLSKPLKLRDLVKIIEAIPL